MKIFILTFFAIFLFLSVTIVEAQNVLPFEPEKGTQATIAINDKMVSYRLTSSKLVQEESFLVDTEKSIHISIDDYNFDGKQEFSVWYMDDGMGIYPIHRVFLFSPSNNKFIEIRPRCGDEFINLKVNRRKKTLTSTYYENNIAKPCTSKPCIPKQ